VARVRVAGRCSGWLRGTVPRQDSSLDSAVRSGAWPVAPSEDGTVDQRRVPPQATQVGRFSLTAQQVWSRLDWVPLNERRNRTPDEAAVQRECCPNNSYPNNNEVALSTADSNKWLLLKEGYLERQTPEVIESAWDSWRLPNLEISRHLGLI
jgi:hypothetical protein